MQSEITKEKTLGKFHNFIWFFWIPVSFLVSAYRAISVTKSYILNYSPFAYGGMILTIFCATFLLEMVFVASPALVFIGFFHTKKYAWFILVLESASNIVSFPILLFRKAGIYDAATILGKTLGVALDIIIVIYYWQRRNLFSVGKRESHVRKTLPENNAETQEYVYCSHCGNKVSADSKYCNRCGFEI